MTKANIDIHQDGPALRITLDRPEVLNALSLALLGELREALEGPATDDSVRAVLITGAGRGFCAGADLADTRVDGDIGGILERSYHPVVRAIAALPKPVVAGVNGVAAGAGMSLALACDVRLLSSAASFALGFTGIGLVMDAGSSYYLPRLVGPGRALEMAFSNRRVKAEEALAIGLGERILDAEGFEGAVWHEVRAMAEGPTRAFALAKREVRASLDHDLEQQLALEARCQAEAARSQDVREGIAAFREKRQPRFQGR
ncbi:MAG: enoyl-CoA hydratase-related protein [Trueperaceae bacterium]